MQGVQDQETRCASSVVLHKGRCNHTCDRQICCRGSSTLEVRAGEILLTNHSITFASFWEIPLANNQILLQIWRNPRGWGEGRRRGAVPLGSCRGEAFHTAGGQGWGRPAVNKIPAAQKYFSQLNEIIIARKKNTSHNSKILFSPPGEILLTTHKIYVNICNCFVESKKDTFHTPDTN